MCSSCFQRSLCVLHSCYDHVISCCKVLLCWQWQEHCTHSGSTHIDCLYCAVYMSTGVSSSSKKESKPSSSSKANDHSDYTTQSSSLSPNRIVAFMIYHSDYTTQSSSLSPKRNTQSPLQQQQSKGSIRGQYALRNVCGTSERQWSVVRTSNSRHTNSINAQVCRTDQLGTNCLAVRSIMFVSCTVDSSNACGNYTAFRVQMRQVFMQ
jgi:hypothetical protein